VSNIALYSIGSDI